MKQGTFDIERDFGRQDYNAWAERVRKSRKDGSLDGLLPRGVGELVDKVLYTAADLEGLSAPGVPGQAPFVRGSRADAKSLVCALHDEPRLEFAAQHIENDVLHGVDALLLSMGPRRGVRVWNSDHIAQLLSPVDLGTVPVWLAAHEDSLPVAAAFLSVARRSGVDWKDLRGGLGIDPLGWLAETGQLRGGLEVHLQIMKAFTQWSLEHAPNLRAITVSAVPYHNAGATEAQQVGWLIATAIQYLRLLSESVGAEKAAQQITLMVPVSGDFFAQVAKLRAVRWLWSEVLRSAGVDEASAPPFVHALSSQASKTKYDPWVNVIRGTAECAAAMVGGANMISVLPFDVRFGHSDSFARRVARNTHLVLRDESYLESVTDAAAGSWYVESLTERLAQAAWDEARAVEERGGMIKAVKFGYVATAMEDVAAERQVAVATRKTAIVGVNQYPNLNEKLIERESVDEYSLRMSYHATGKMLSPDTQRDFLQRLYDKCQTFGADVVDLCLEAVEAGLPLDNFGVALWHARPDLFVEPLRRLYLSEPWENLRERSRKMLTSCGRRPRCWLISLGNSGAARERALWMRNLLEAGGIEVADQPATEPLSFDVEAWRAIRTDYVALCAADADYNNSGLPAFVEQARKQGCRAVMVAGKPEVVTDPTTRALVHHYLYTGVDALDILQALWEEVGA